jgi:hypothetical protein
MITVHEAIIYKMQERIAELERENARLQEQRKEAIYAAAQATGELEALVSLLHRIDEEARNGWIHVHSNGGD